MEKPLKTLVAASWARSETIASSVQHGQRRDSMHVATDAIATADLLSSPEWKRNMFPVDQMRGRHGPSKQMHGGEDCTSGLSYGVKSQHRSTYQVDNREPSRCWSKSLSRLNCSRGMDMLLGAEALVFARKFLLLDTDLQYASTALASCRILHACLRVKLFRVPGFQVCRKGGHGYRTWFSRKVLTRFR